MTHAELEVLPESDEDAAAELEAFPVAFAGLAGGLDLDAMQKRLPRALRGC